MNFDRFLTDSVTLFKKDGTAYKNVKAAVQSKMIVIADTSLPVEVGDKITRILPSGVKETFVITDPGFHQGVGSIAGHYQARYEREGAAKPSAPRGDTTYNVSGAHARVNVDSVDQSVNIGDTQVGATLDQVRGLLRDQVADAEERASLLAKVDELQQAHGTDEFAGVYKEFMALAANHMAVLAPLVPALAALL